MKPPTTSQAGATQRQRQRARIEASVKQLDKEIAETKSDKKRLAALRVKQGYERMLNRLS